MHILGVGAIGSVFAHHLARTNPVLLVRPGRTGAVRIRTGNAVVEHAFRAETPASSGRIADLVVLTKAYAVRPALESIKHRLDETNVVILSNGALGIMRELAQSPIFPACRFVCGFTNLAAIAKADHVDVTGVAGKTLVGYAPQAGDVLAKLQAAPGLNVELVRDEALLLRRLQEKVVVNTCINPLTALLRCKNGELLNSPTAMRWIAEICGECSVAFRIPQSELLGQVTAVIRATRDNSSSMLQDFEHCRRTENDYFAGYVDSILGAKSYIVRQMHELVQMHDDVVFEQ